MTFENIVHRISAAQNAVRLALFGECPDQICPILQPGGTLKGEVTQFFACHEDELADAMGYAAVLGHVDGHSAGDVIHGVGGH